MVACILSFHAELDALALLHLPALDQRHVEHVDPRPANVERARRSTKRVRRRTRERGLVEIVVQPVVNIPRRRRVADQVRTLRAIPERSARLSDLQRETVLEREECADLPPTVHHIERTGYSEP